MGGWTAGWRLRRGGPQNENEIGLVVDQSIDWLYQKLFVLVHVENVKGQKEYRIASCDLGKRIICYIIKLN